MLPTPPTEQVARAVRYHTPQPSPVVIANGVQGLSATRELQTFFRAYAWVVDVRGADVHPWSIGEFGRKVQRLSAQVESNAAGEFQVTAPTVQLAAAATSPTPPRAGCCCSAEKGRACCLRSRSSPPPRCGAMSRTRDGA